MKIGNLIILFLLTGSINGQLGFIEPYKIGSYYEYEYREGSFTFRYFAKIEGDTIIKGIRYLKYVRSVQPVFGTGSEYYSLDTASHSLFRYRPLCSDADSLGRVLLINFDFPVGYRWGECAPKGLTNPSEIIARYFQANLLNFQNTILTVLRKDTIPGEFQSYRLTQYKEKFGIDSIFQPFGGIFTGSSFLITLKGAKIDGIVYGEILLRAENNSNFLPENYRLEQNYPNPFNPATIINYELPITNYVTLKVYDVLGKEVTTLVNENLERGNHTVNFDGSDLTSGIYFYKIEGGDFKEIKRMLLIR